MLRRTHKVTQVLRPDRPAGAGRSLGRALPVPYSRIEEEFRSKSHKGNDTNVTIHEHDLRPRIMTVFQGESVAATYFSPVRLYSCSFRFHGICLC